MSGFFGGGVSVPGPTGATGRSFLHGEGAPDNGTGINGDYYIDDLTADLYGPKAGGAWPVPVSLIGPTGPAGADGAQGPQGEPGPAGADGSSGPSVQMFSFGTPAPTSYDGIHASYEATEAGAFPGPFTNPAIPRTPQVQFTAGAASVTLAGTDWQDQAITEEITPTGGGFPDNVAATKAFKTVSGATANGALTASIGWESKLQIQTEGTVTAYGFAWKNMGAFPSPQAVTIDAVNKTAALSIDGTSAYFLMIQVTPPA